MPALYHGLLPRVVPPFVLPSLSANQRGLVLGMGGGCDGFAAFALAQKWGSAVEGPVLYGNCIGQRAMPDDHEQIADHLWCGPAEPRALAPGDEAYGSTRLELSIPRGVDGSPLLFVVPRHTGPVAEASAENQVALCGALRAMRIDSVVAVDLGGDSLTGGIDFKGSDPEMGRDRQVLQALRASGLPCVHVVLGPGCDGESAIDAMRRAVREADERGALLGVLPQMLGIVPAMAGLAASLSPNRTPNIIQRAMVREAEAAGGDAAAPEGEAGLCSITRHGQTQAVPWSWLTVGLAFRVP